MRSACGLNESKRELSVGRRRRERCGGGGGGGACPCGQSAMKKKNRAKEATSVTRARATNELS